MRLMPATGLRGFVLACAASWACAAAGGSLVDPVDPSFGIARASAPNAQAPTHVAVGNDGRVFPTRNPVGPGLGSMAHSRSSSSMPPAITTS